MYIYVNLLGPHTYLSWLISPVTLTIWNFPYDFHAPVTLIIWNFPYDFHAPGYEIIL